MVSFVINSWLKRGGVYGFEFGPKSYITFMFCSVDTADICLQSQATGSFVSLRLSKIHFLF
jgi:hypothetical protein